MPELTMEATALRAAAGRAAGFLRLMANEDRLLLLCQLTEGECCVSDLESRTGIEQPTLSQQLGVLREEGLVKTRRDGKYVYYSIGDPRVGSMLLALHGLFCSQKKSRKGATHAA